MNSTLLHCLFEFRTFLPIKNINNLIYKQYILSNFTKILLFMDK